MNDPQFKIYFRIDSDSSALSLSLDEAFVIGIECDTGDVYEVSVWTEAYFHRVWMQNRETGERLHGQYLIPPDLIVADSNVEAIQQVVADLIKTDRLCSHWQVPDEYTAELPPDELIPDYTENQDPQDEHHIKVLHDEAAVCGRPQLIARLQKQ